MKTIFAKLEKLLRDVAAARQEHKANLEKLQAMRGVYSDQHVNEQTAKANQVMTQFHIAMFDKAVTILEELRDAAIAKRGVIPALDTPKLANALKLIELSAGRPPFEVGQEITRQFAGDPLALAALKDIYKAQGAASNYGISELLYDPEPAFASLVESAREALYYRNSLNRFAVSIAKIATCEGFEFPKMVDEAGANEVMREAAGLPVVK